MFRLTTLSILVMAAFVSVAGANGRDPGTSTISFRPDMESHIVAGMTFGLIRSDDGGSTWRWYCERAIGYGGTYDPDYAYMPSGALFATTFDGLKVMRDECSFVATPPGMSFVTHVERGPDNALYFSTSDPNDSKIYKSTDDGVTFPSSAEPGMLNDWWQTLIVARSDASRVYLSGYRLLKKCTSNATNAGAACTVDTDCPGGLCENQKEFLLYKSVNGGASYVPMSTANITPLSLNSAIEMVGVDPANADIVYARATLESTTSGESIYKSTDAGASWTKVLTRSPSFGGLSFLVRNDGTCVAATRDMGAWTSTTCNANSWVALTNPPHIGCLYENAANEVWACTQNTGSVQLSLPSDGFGIMKSSDLATWTGVLRFEDIQAPVACAAGTVQEDRCVQRYMGEQSQWCCLKSQLGITSSAVDCTGSLACFGVVPEPPVVVDGPPLMSVDGVPMTREPSTGCCDASSRPPVLATVFVFGFLMRRRRRRPSVHTR